MHIPWASFIMTLGSAQTRTTTLTCLGWSSTLSLDSKITPKKMSCRRKWTTNNLQRKLEVALKGEKSLHSIQRHFTYYVKIHSKESHFSVKLLFLKNSLKLKFFFNVNKVSRIFQWLFPKVKFEFSILCKKSVKMKWVLHWGAWI